VEGTSREMLAAIKKANPIGFKEQTEEDWNMLCRESLIFQESTWPKLFIASGKKVQCQKYTEWEEAFVFLLFKHQNWKTATKALFMQRLELHNMNENDRKIKESLREYRMGLEDGASWVFPVLRSDKSHTFEHGKYWSWSNKRQKK